MTSVLFIKYNHNYKQIMKRVILIFILLTNATLAAGDCFIVKEKNRVLQREGECSAQLTQGCDFSILLSVMGFDSGILKDEKTPEWQYSGQEVFLNAWKKSYNPRTWIVDSCVWYSDNIIDKLGSDKIAQYVYKFKYGDQNAEGINKENWPGDLKISPEEQINFLQKLVDNELPVSHRAIIKTKNILFIQDMVGGWKLYGKTGVGEGGGEERIGWFVGWISKGDRNIPFASNVVFSKKQDKIPSFIARNHALEKLFWIINNLEK